MTTKLLHRPSQEVTLGNSIGLLVLDTAAGRLYVLADGSGWWDGAGWHVAQAEVPRQLLSPDGRRWWSGIAWAVRPDGSGAAPVVLAPADAVPEPVQGYRYDVAPGEPPSDPVPDHPVAVRTGSGAKPSRSRSVRSRSMAASSSSCARGATRSTRK